MLDIWSSFARSMLTRHGLVHWIRSQGRYRYASDEEDGGFDGLDLEGIGWGFVSWDRFRVYYSDGECVDWVHNKGGAYWIRCSS